MKVLDIAVKDLRRSSRSLFAVGMMVVVPLLITGLIAFAFGGLRRGQADLRPARVVVANLDRPAPSSGIDAGKLVADALQDQSLAKIIQATTATGETSARAAVEQRAADVAVVIPADFTAAVLDPAGRAEVRLYHDATLTIAPEIVKSVIGEILDGFNGGRAFIKTSTDQLAEEGLPVDSSLIAPLTRQYGEWARVGSHHIELGETSTALAVRAPSGQAAEMNLGSNLIASIMAGMLIFFVFFTGTNTAQSILREHEEGTLARLFSTPTPRGVILGGKFTAVFVTIAGQIVVLLAASAWLFHIRWGAPLALATVMSGLLVAASGFGVFVVSFIKSTRQAGPIIGGVQSLAGILGGLFTTGVQGLPRLFDHVKWVTPHGWALVGLKRAVAGAGPSEVLVPTLVLLVMGATLFGVGVLAFRRRFAS